MEKRLRKISRFFVAPQCEFAPAVRTRPRTPFSINTTTSAQYTFNIADSLKVKGYKEIHALRDRCSLISEIPIRSAV